MNNDALKERDILKPGRGEKCIVRVRCHSCRELNQDAKYSKNLQNRNIEMLKKDIA